MYRILTAVLGLAVLAPSVAQAYSINTTERGRQIRWADSKVTLHLDRSFAELLDDEGAPRALQIGLDAWTGFEGVPAFEVSAMPAAKPGHVSEKATNGLYVPKQWDHEPNKLAITVVTYEMASGRLLDADILVNPGVRFALLREPGSRADGAYDLAAVLTHELGHVLGLGESQEDRMATMWPYADVGDTHQRTLSEDDEDGILDAYEGPPPLPAASCAPLTVAGRPAAPPAWLAWLVLTIAAGLLLRARKRVLQRVTIASGFSLLLFGGTGLLRSDDARPELDMPSEVERIEAPSASARVSRLTRDVSVLRIGHARRVDTVKREGFLYTEYEVETRKGERVRVTLPGGEQDGIGQRFGEASLPKDGSELAVSEDGRRFAYHHQGRLWGGSLGDGAAIDLR